MEVVELIRVWDRGIYVGLFVSLVIVFIEWVEEIPVKLEEILLNRVPGDGVFVDNRSS